DIVIKTPYFDVNLGKNNISKCVSINGFDIKSEKLKYSEISNLDGIIVNIPRIKDGVKEVTFLKNNKFKLNNLIDIYYIKDNNKIELLETGVDTTNGVTFKLTKDEKNNVYTKYIFVYVPIKDFNFNFESIELNKNCTKQLEVTFIPENCTDKDIVYNLEDKEICEISKDNVLKAKKVGEYKINTKIKNINKSFNLKINEVAENIKVNKKSISLFIGQTTTIIASVLPKNAINNELEYISSDDKIVTINEIGKVVSKKVGKCEIEIKTKIEPIVSVKIPITIN
ncbi:MAG: Ig-like domain-containing protein, partial [Clostridia bacterium]